MGIFGLSKSDKAAIITSLKAMQNRTIESMVSELNRNIAIYPTYDIAGNAERYATTDDIYSIVRMLSQTAGMVPLRAYEVKADPIAKKAARELKELHKPYQHPLRYKALQLKALEDLSDNDPLNILLEKPSADHSKFEFFEAVHAYLLLNGEAFILKERPEFGSNAGKVVNLFLLPPQNVTIKVTSSFPRKIAYYKYSIDTTVIFDNIEPADIIHIKYFNPEVTFMGAELRGLSPIRVLAKRLTQLDSNVNVQTAQMQNGGVETIVYDKAPNDMAAVDVNGSRKDNFYRFLKNPSNAGAPFFASGEMGMLHIGSSLADLKIIESASINFKKLCNAFGTSDILFNNDAGSTESNVQEMVKRTYTNTILPNVYRVRDALIKGLLYEFKGNYDIREDISEISELQPNMKDMVEWLDKAWWVTPNDKLEMMRYERNPDPLMDQPLVPTGLVPLQDLMAIPDLPIVTPNGN